MISELTLLQYHASILGGQADHTPKCHPEIAGEGIEYLWALATKVFYRGARIKQKRNRNVFYKLVKDCLCQKNFLIIVRLRGSSRQACEYMLAYKTIKEVQQEVKEENKQLECHVQDKRGSSPSSSQSSAKQSYTPFDMNHELIEKMIKTYKSHHNAAMFDVAFIKGLKGLDHQEKCHEDG
jgi:hypothetical protein